MKISILLLSVLLKAVISANINNENIKTIKVADDEIVCNYFSLPLLSAELLENKEKAYSNEHNANAFIIRKKAEYSCGMQIKTSNYNRLRNHHFIFRGRNKRGIIYIDYKIFYLSAVKKAECNANYVTYCDLYSTCDAESKKVICCDSHYCNNLNNINIEEKVYSFKEKKFLNSNLNASCIQYQFFDPFALFPSRKEVTINSIMFTRNYTGCSVASLKKQPLFLNKNILQINIADDEIICKFCAFAIFAKKDSYYQDYQEKCEDDAFVIVKKSKNKCGFFLDTSSYFVNYFAVKRINNTLVPNSSGSAAVAVYVFVSGAIKKENCQGSAITLCNFKSCGRNKYICCAGNNCNNFNKISFDYDMVLYNDYRFLKYTDLINCNVADREFSYDVCSIIKFNASQTNELEDVQDQSKKNCECNQQNNLAVSYITLFILATYSFFYND
jgi:hypothetical protein